MNPFEDMQTFVRIVEAGSITKAAEQLETVKSAISRRLSELEKRLGVSLLVRTTRSQVLTESGQKYYEHCLRIIDDLAEIETSVSDEHSALTGRIKITAPLTFGLAHLGIPMRKFNQLHPGIIFDVDFNERTIDLIEEGCDLAIRISELEDSSLIAKPISYTNLILCASPAYLKQHGTPKTPQDLNNNHVKLQFKHQPDKWEFIDKKGKSVAVKLPIVMQANNSDFLCQAAIEGAGLIFLPDFICYKYVQSGLLTPLLSNHTLQCSINVNAVYPQTRHLPQRVRSFIDFLEEYFGEEPYWKI